MLDHPLACRSISRHRRLSALGAVSMLVCSIVPASASEWTMFRGPNGQGVTEAGSLPTEIGPDQSMLWRAELPGGSSSPVVFRERIYLTAFDDEDLLVIALDAKGQELWRRAAPRTRREKLDNRNDAASPSAVVDEQGLVVFFGDYGLLAYDHDGREQWTKALGPFRNLYGVGASPVIVEDLLILSVDQHMGSFLLALDRTNGRQRWLVERPEARTGHSTPIVYVPPGGDPQLVLPGSFLLTAYAAATGEKLWWVHGLSFEMKSVPAVGAGHLFINGYGSQFNDPDQGVATREWKSALAASDLDGDGRISSDELKNDEFAQGWFDFNDLDGDGLLMESEWQYFRDALATKNNMMAVRLPSASERGDLTASHVAWQHFRNVPQLPSPVIYRDVLWMVSDRGIVTTFVPRTGEVLNKGRVAGGAESYYASPVAGDGKIWLAARSGLISVLPPDGSLEPLHQVELDETITATPALVAGRIFVRTAKALWAFGAPDRASEAEPEL